ncbi:uncharacterized protein DUF563 [Novosphingobium sp. PhB55]|nr:uncharacterized protein DUF563 [Novosphingobium sp. PhB55]
MRIGPVMNAGLFRPLTVEAPRPAPPQALSLRPAMALAARLLRQPRPDIAQAAVERWQVAPGSCTQVRRAKVLPGQFERIADSEFASISEVVRQFKGDFEAKQSATIGYRLKNALLHDGVLYAGGTLRHLQRRSRFLPVARAPREETRMALFESWLGNRWFGNWLSDDCLTYRLAENAGIPFTTHGSSGHVPDYERALDMLPVRGPSAFFRELVLFDDAAHNENKRLRAEAMRQRLIRGPIERHPGVFLLRGRSGDARFLTNESEIAETLARRRGFQVLDPSHAGLEEIVRACGGAKVVMGVEGSHLVHGLAMMPPDGCAFVIQPPLRAVAALKLLTDRQGQDYALVVGEGTNHAFTANIDEIERTLDLV